MFRRTTTALLLFPVLALTAAPRARAAQPLTSSAYVALALAASPEVRQAEETRRAADDAYKAQFAAMVLPTLAFTAQEYPAGDDPLLGYSHHGLRLRRSDAAFNTTANWNLFNGFQDLTKTRIAEQTKADAESAFDAVRQDRAFAAVQAFYQLTSRARLRDVARQDLSAQEEQYRQTEDLYKHGLKSLSDLYKSETEWHASEIRLVQAEADYKGSLQPFNSLIARPPWEEAALADDLTPGATDLPRLDEDAALLERRRPEIARARAEERRSQEQERQSLLSALPALSLNATWNRQDLATGGVSGSVLNGPNPNSQIGLSLSLPFGFNAVTQGYGYAGARAARRAARAAAELALRAARDELYAAWVSLEGATRTYALSARQEEIAAKGLEIVEDEYRQGTADALRMAQARADLLTARVQTATALQSIYTGRASYRRAAGVKLW